MPITAIVIFRNERQLLDGCLRALRGWCDEVIAVDMESTDGSLQVAERYADRILNAPFFPIAEPTRVAAAAYAKNDWVLLIDPDEHIPRGLVERIRNTLSSKPDAGAVRLPWRYYFKRKRLNGTIWGTDGAAKRMLIHRERCRLLPFCNRITDVMDGFEDVLIPHDDRSHVRHYWCDSYAKLLMRHLRRYCHLEAAAQVASGKRFSLRLGFVHPLVELNRCLRHFDGWRLGPRGFLLSGIYFVYVVASSWLVLYYQRRRRQRGEDSLPTKIPTLTEMTPKEASPTRGAAA